MKVRNLLTAFGVFVVVVSFSLLGYSAALAQPDTSAPPAIVVGGLAMVQLEDQAGLRIALPDAPGHKATITFVMKDGSKRVLPFKGHGVINVSEPGTSLAMVKVPELVRMKEIYGAAIKPLLDRSPDTILIPWPGVRRVSTEKVTDARYTFVRKDSGEEVETFRPRQIAESLRIELTSGGSLDFNRTKTNFDPEEVREIRIENLPAGLTSDNPFLEHFHHYVHYVDRPADKNFDVEPRKLSGQSNVSPRVGNSFWIGAYVLCFVVGVD